MFLTSRVDGPLRKTEMSLSCRNWRFRLSPRAGIVVDNALETPMTGNDNTADFGKVRGLNIE